MNQTAAPTINPDPLATPTPDVGRVALRTATPIGVHAGVDFISFAVVSLIPLLTTKLQLETWQVALMLGLSPVCSGAVQPLVAHLSDRHDHRWLGTAGIVLAGVCIGSTGLATSYWQLITLFLLGQIGVGAFHPPAAAAVGHLAGKRMRGVALGVFFLLGMIGGMSGNVLTPRIIGAIAGDDTPEQINAALRWLLALGPISILLALAVAKAIHNIPHRHADAHANHHALDESERRRRWTNVGLLYVCNVIRFTVNNALIYLYVQWATSLAASRAEAGATKEQISVDASVFNGILQAAMQFGAGFGGIGLGYLIGRRFGHTLEKPLFVVIPVLGAIGIAAFPFIAQLDTTASPLATNAVALTVSAIGGLGFGSLIPVSMSIAQRLLPHRAALASGMMLGGAWCFAVVGPILAERIHQDQDERLRTAFFAVAALLTVSAVIGATLDGKLLRESAHD
ncbi:MAG: MFS transporter [Planctomycetota bacterium]